MVADSELQRIARLTPLADVLASFDISVGPVTPRAENLRRALGRTLAADAVAPEARPQQAIALRDGYAVRADLTTDASSYAPAPLSPAPTRVNVGDALPADADAVAPLDAVTERGGLFSILASIAPGEGVLAAQTDATPDTPLRLAGARLRRIDVAVLAALCVKQVTIREPRVRVVRAGYGEPIDAAVTLIASAIEAEGGIAIADDVALDDALARDDADAVFAVGGTGGGRNDTSVQTLTKLGRVAFHGVGITPGETTAIGFAGTRPVMLLPGRVDAALAGWLTVGRRVLAKLCFRLIEEQPFTAELSKKIASPLGLAEVVPVRRRLATVEPLATGYLPLQALARADGWILVPADSEGHPTGTKVMVRPWP